MNSIYHRPIKIQKKPVSSLLTHHQNSHRASQHQIASLSWTPITSIILRLKFSDKPFHHHIMFIHSVIKPSEFPFPLLLLRTCTAWLTGIICQDFRSPQISTVCNLSLEDRCNEPCLGRLKATEKCDHGHGLLTGRPSIEPCRDCPNLFPKHDLGVLLSFRN